MKVVLPFSMNGPRFPSSDCSLKLSTSSPQVCLAIRVNICVIIDNSGVNRHFNLGQLVNYMNNIYEDEEYTDFAVFLTPDVIIYI